MQGEQAEQAGTCLDNGEDEQESDDASEEEELETDEPESIDITELVIEDGRARARAGGR